MCPWFAEEMNLLPSGEIKNGNNDQENIALSDIKQGRYILIVNILVF